MLSNFKYENNYFLVDRCSIEYLPSPIVAFIQSQGLLSSINGQRVSFCGLMTYQGENYFFYPRQTVLENVLNNPIKHCSILMQSLLKFAQASKTKVFNPEEGVEPIGFEKLEIFKFLIRDFQLHGIFQHEETKTLRNSGKTDWRRTINRSTPFPDKGNSPIYLESYGKKRTSINNEITKIHGNVLRQIFNRYSFIFTGNHDVPNILKEYGASTLSIDSQIIILKNEIRNHYADRQTVLLRALIDYLKEYKGNTQNNSIIGVKRFHVAWESMLSQIYENVIDINSRLPKPVFIKGNNATQVAKKSGMRTDIVIEYREQEKLIVLDAKYYDATTVDNAPGWADLVKQFFYEKALAEMSEFKDYKIENALIFPGNDAVFKEIKMQDQESLFFLDKSFPPIKCIYLNPIDVMQSYLIGQKIFYQI